MTSKSLWINIDVAPDAGVLDGVQQCDVAVIGSGIAGISTAYELCQRGTSVIVIDRGRICGGHDFEDLGSPRSVMRRSRQRDDEDQGE